MGCVCGKKTKIWQDKCLEIQKPLNTNENIERKTSREIIFTIKNQSWVEEKPQNIDNSHKEQSKILDSPQQLIKFDDSLFAHFNSKNLYTNYELMGKLGEGFYGYVRLANHRETRKQRAVKSIEKSKMSSTQTEKNKFFNEFEILKQTDHPNIVKIFEYYEDRTYFHLVMEYISGGKLLDYLAKTKTFSESTAAHFIQQILSALVYCHEKGIIHGDLEPDNILLDSFTDKSIVKIVGFGNSVLKGNGTVFNSQSHSVQFTAPEVLKNENFCEKCDIWSCGTILYLLLSGKTPFPGRTQDIIKQRVLAGDFSLKGLEWNNISLPAKNLLSQMLVYNSNSRITAQGALNSPWIQENLKSLNLFSNLNTENLINLTSLQSNQQFKQAVLMFIANFALSKDRLQELTLTFRKLDKNGDGKLSREELKEVYNKTTKHKRTMSKQIDEIMEIVDKDKTGFISYSDFVTACLKQEEIDNEVNLEMAFKAFDEDKSGKISIEELRRVFGIGSGKIKDLKNLLMEVDNNGDGEIDFVEFKKMMIKGLS
ncbi:hypothetical protein SteCoe_8043 [Stentor coeruleus]|uniref:non-specific serine/threonine protein kinase n=1 Tax=Stentor coeruleus TaxID=5963 RepID=A0A1R2CL74_9CILI|nr:hypothetical protein SteCoe_8043 [Stentor coeruleus]